MKVFFLLVLSFAFVVALTKDEAKQKLRDADKECNSNPETAVDREALDKWRKEGGEEPANLKAHALCVSKKLGLQDENGKIVKDAIKEKVLIWVSEDKANEIVEKCAKEQANEAETAQQLLGCIMRRPLRN